MRIHLMRTFHQHWGQHTGAHQFIYYLDPERFRIDDRIIKMGDDDFPVKARPVRLGIKYLVRRKGMRVYGLNDLLAEFDAGRQWWHKKIDILHYLEGEHSLQFLPSVVSKLHRLRPRPPMVATFHQPPELLKSLICMDSVEQVDRVIVLSPEQVSFFEQYLPADRISMILHGIDTSFFCPAKQAEASGEFRCLSVGSWLRDYDAVLEVAHRLSSVPDFQFHIVSSAVTDQASPGNVFVQSGIDDNALRSMYQQADVLFLPVTSATANNAILEGIACGLPVVTTDLASLRCYLPGQEAILVKDNDPEQLAEALLKLYHNPEWRTKMAEAARRRALDLSWAKIAQEHASLYEELFTRSSIRRASNEGRA